LVSSAPWASAAYLFSYLIAGVTWFAVTLTLILVSGILSIFWIGLPLLFLSLGLVRGMAAVERARARIVGITLTPRYRPAPKRGLRATLRNGITDPARWRDIVALVVLWPWLVLVDLLGLIAWLVPLTLVSLPFWYRSIPNHFDNGTSAHGIVLGYFPDGPYGATHYGWFIGDLSSALVAAGVGLVLLGLVGNYVVVGAARVHVRAVARWFGTGPAPRRDVTAHMAVIPDPRATSSAVTSAQIAVSVR
jgi:hypothetical protein